LKTATVKWCWPTAVCAAALKVSCLQSAQAKGYRLKRGTPLTKAVLTSVAVHGVVRRLLMSPLDIYMIIGWAIVMVTFIGPWLLSKLKRNN